ncbi:nucleoporin-interacting protein NIC96 [Thelephora ganbajun]|uniref:Nucleoporin-interacting protein NIC96 n=1 Tax=Thelephora ganbajun TaxID=370292 RepID=A0ACB6ZPF5_THEGA|nr:nucleoporin-interacting protein NIC96 [Thelephora ganbajun]
MASNNLSSLLTGSKALTSHLQRPDLPSVNLSLDQIEAQSRRLVAGQPGTPADSGRGNYLLAQAHVDAPALATSIANLNTTTTFSPLQPLQDTDVAGYLRHAHEQNLISTIEEGRRETQEEFYRTLEEHGRREWEAKKKRVFEELGGRLGGENTAISDFKKSSYGRNIFTSSTVSTPNLQLQSKMMIYDRVVAGLNAARLRETSHPVFHALIEASLSIAVDVSQQMTQIYHILSKITAEPPALPPVEHAGAHVLNAPLFERKYARVYLGDPESREAVALRKQIANGAREALEEQYWDVLERTLQARPMDARLGGDPSVANRVRAFLLIKHYKNGEWGERIELVAGQPIWAKLFYLVRTGHPQEAIDEAISYQQAIDHREPSFLANFKTWLESPDRKLPKLHRDHLQSTYNGHMLHSSTTDPFKLALYKLMGKIDPSKRTVTDVTVTTEDWLWFQLTMLDEEEFGGLRGLSDVVSGYGQRHFDGPPNQRGSRKGVWAAVLTMCGQFERAIAALWEQPETEVEAVHLAIALAYHGLLRQPSRAETSDMTPLSLPQNGVPALSLSTIIWRYVRQFVKMDAKEALQYVYCICLSADQGGGVGKEQIENAWELARRIIVLANAGTAWEELVGGFRADGTRFSGIIEQGASLLKLTSTQDYHAEILVRAAKHSEQNDRTPEAIKLYNLAGDYGTVISCLASALGTTISRPTPDEKSKAIEKTAVDILRHYERTNRAVGRDREAVTKLLRIREAINAKEAGRPEVVLEIMESTNLIPLDGDMSRTTRKAEEFKEYHDALQRNLQTYLTLTMDALSGVHQKTKASLIPDSARQMVLGELRRKSRSLMVFAGILKYRMSSDIYSYLARLDVEIAL